MTLMQGSAVVAAIAVKELPISSLLSTTPGSVGVPSNHSGVTEKTQMAYFRVSYAAAAGAYTRPRFSSTQAVLVTPPPVPRVPMPNRLGERHAPNVSHKTCLR